MDDDEDVITKGTMCYVTACFHGDFTGDGRQHYRAPSVGCLVGELT